MSSCASSFDEGFDAGARTIHWHLSKRRSDVPSISTIWRILARRGFIEQEPNKRPHNSFIRFEAALPNECWQADVTHWRLKDGSDVEILDFDHPSGRLRPPRKSAALAARVGHRFVGQVCGFRAEGIKGKMNALDGDLGVATTTRTNVIEGLLGLAAIAAAFFTVDLASPHLGVAGRTALVVLVFSVLGVVQQGVRVRHKPDSEATYVRAWLMLELSLLSGQEALISEGLAEDFHLVAARDRR